MPNEIELKVTEALAEDVGQGFARLDPADMQAMNACLGDLIEIAGQKKTVARVTGAFADNYGKKFIQIDSIIRSNAKVNIGDVVKIKKVPRNPAVTVVLNPLELDLPLPEPNEVARFSTILQSLPIIVGDKINLPFFGGKKRFFQVDATSPAGPLIVDINTKFIVKRPDFVFEEAAHVAYEDIGGLINELKLVREMVELPLRYGEVFEKLGIEAPKGVLLYGPPGTGKTLIGRALASETKLHFIRINGPEIIHKFYGESEARLREIFEEASRKAPSIIFIDEIDAIAPKRLEVLGEVEKRVVAQLLALMDGMISRGHVVVIGATNIPENIDPALRRPGRFDREIVIPVPNVDGRLRIIKIHSRRMPLAPDVDLDHLAHITHGFVGADLEVLCKEAGMVSLRKCLSLEGDHDINELINTPGRLQVTMDDFLMALREIEPTATREFYTERSTVKWDHIGGLKKIKDTLISIVEWPEKYPELFAAGKMLPPRGILFSGPSGTGKTFMAKALAGETGLNFISINAPILFSKWLGESEKALHQIFKKAKQSAPCILFFDEIDALVASRGDQSTDGGTVERMASLFFNELDGLSEHSEVIILGATNREDLLDPALMSAGRLDFVLRFPFPNEAERLDIFKVHTKEKPIGPDVDLKELAQETEGMAGSHIAVICKRATMLAITESINKKGTADKLLITHAHFEAALNEIRGKKVVLKC